MGLGTPNHCNLTIFGHQVVLATPSLNQIRLHLEQ